MNGDRKHESMVMTIGQYQELLAYWNSKIQDMEVMTALIPDRRMAAAQEGKETVCLHFPSPLSQKLLAVSGHSPFGLFMIIATGMQLLFSRITGTSDVTLGIPMFRPSDEDGNRHLLPLRVEIDKKISFRELLNTVKQAVTEADQNSVLPAADVVRLVEEACSRIRGSLFGAAVVLEDVHQHVAPLELDAETVFLFRTAKEEVGADMQLDVSYPSSVFNQATMERYVSLLIEWLWDAFEHPDKPLSELDLIHGDMKQIVLEHFNDTKEAYPRDMSISELFAEQAEQTPERLAVDDGTERLTYRELNERANRLAVLLRDCGVGLEQPVGLLAGRSTAFVTAVFAVLKAGGAYVPLDPDYPQERIGYMLADSGAKVLLVAPDLAPPPSFGGTILRLDASAWEDGSAEKLALISAPEHLAYIMYTSGTTGRPKGVMVEQRNVVRLVKNGRYVPFEAESRFAMTGAIGFDAITFELFGALLNGATLYTVGKETLLDEERLHTFLVRNAIHILWLTTSLFNQLAQVNPHMFGSVKHLIVGGEALSAKHIRIVQAACPDVTVWNGYGPTENTTFSTSFRIERTEGEEVSIGRPIGNSTAYIMSREGKLQPIGVPGELCVGGDGVARGYLNTPELTAEKFVADPFAPGGRMYLTGDLAIWEADGTIRYLGRMDRQVKVRGHRIEPAEVEASLRQVPSVRESVVVVREDGQGEKALWGYYTSEEGMTAAELRKSLSGVLPGYMIPARLVRMETMPLTTNGKIDRAALPVEVQENEVETPYVAPRTETEAELVRLWQDLLGVKRIGIRDSFFDRGGHSLRATTLLSLIHERFHVNLPLKLVFEQPTVEQIAVAIEETDRTIYTAMAPVEKRPYYSVSSAQKRMFVLDRMEGNGISYNIPAVMTIEGELDYARFNESFRLLIERHEALRTSFRILDGEPVQQIHDEFQFAVQILDIAEMEPSVTLEDLARLLNRPFHIGEPCLPHVCLVSLAEKRHFFFFNLHHIVADGSSMGILIREFNALYGGRELPRMSLQYKDFAMWQNSRQGTEERKRHEAFWLKQITGDWPVLNLTTDRPRPEVQSFTGDQLLFDLPQESAERAKRLAAEAGTTLYMVLLAAFNKLLSRYSSQEDLVVGTGVAGRTHADVQQMIGMFVNMLALRTQPAGSKTFRQYLAEVREVSLESFEHQDYPFDALVESSGIERDPGRNPLFDVAFVVQNMEFPELALEGLRFNALPYNSHTSKFDLTLFVWEKGPRVSFHLEYNTDLFDRATIVRFGKNLTQVIREAVGDPDRLLSDFEILTEEEKRDLLFAEFNQTTQEAPMHMTIHTLFEEQVDRTPNRIAVVCGEESYTYRELEDEANRIAALLRERGGAEPDRLIGVYVEPSLHRTSAVLGVLKAGAAYVPIDPDLPAERVKTILEDAGISLLLTSKRQLQLVGKLQWECPSLSCFVCLDSNKLQEEEETELNELMDEQLWEYVGEQATDDITGGGWTDSYTREPFSRAEMDEYGDNVLLKLKPFLHKNMRVLEIGCASGISMFRIAPLVGLYYGTDLSQVIIEKDRHRVESEGITNIRLACLPAHRIDELVNEEPFDLVIINSVIQVFHGFNYLRGVLTKAIGLLKDQGKLFVGDIMDLERKDALLQSLRNYKQSHPEARTKLDLSSELLVPRGFFEDVAVEMQEVLEVHFSGKIHTIPNELTEYRYDALLHVDKGPQEAVQEKSVRRKHKEQLGRDFLEGYSGVRVESSAASTNIAYVIYTSGTTGKPKGVMIEHRSLVNLANWHIRHFGLTEEDRCTLFAGFGFDASVWELFPPLLAGASLYTLTGEHRMRLPLLKQYYEQTGITVSFLPTQFCEQFIEEGAPSSLRLLLTGGDQLRRFKPELGFTLYNNYGPTENTVVATSYRLDREENPIPIGHPIDNVRAVVLDPYGKLQPFGVPGELCLSGVGVARGYWNESALTSAKFVPHPYEPGQRMYRTGDLVRLRTDGNFEYLGRIDHQVKIRGFRLELGEIEVRLLRIALMKEAVVLVREDESGKELWAYVTAGREIVEADIREQLSASLPSYMVPAHVVQLDAMPLSPNGKVDRKALLRRTERKRRAEFAAPRTVIETKLSELWQEVLGVSSIGIKDNFFELGGDSIKAIQISSRLHKEKLKLELKDLFRYPTIEELTKHVQQAVSELPQGTVAGEVPLTPIQRWFFEQNFTDKHHWNQSVMLFRAEGFESAVIETAWSRLQQHHDALRIVFRQRDGEWVQWNRSPEETALNGFRLSVYEMDDYSNVEHAIEMEAELLQASLDLEHGPLAALGLFKTGEGDHLLMIIHHLLVDAVSWRTLIEDFAELYSSSLSGGQVALPDKTLSFQAWSENMQEFAASRALLREIPVWKRMEQMQAEVTLLPADFEVKERRLKDTATLTVSFSVKETDMILKEAHRAYNTEINDLLLTALALTMQEWTNKTTIAVDLEGHGREAMERDLPIARTVGWFTSMYPVVFHLDGWIGQEPGESLKLVKEKLRSIPRKGLGYSILKYMTPASMRAGLTCTLKPEVSFNYLGEFGGKGSVGDTFVSAYSSRSGEQLSPNAEQTHQLMVNGLNNGGRLQFTFYYNQLEFITERMESLANRFREQLVAVAEHCVSREASERTPSDAGCTELSLQEWKLWSEELPAFEPGVVIEQICSLSPLQEGILFHALYDPASPAYFEQLTLHFEGQLEEELFQESVNVMLVRHDILRSVFRRNREGKPLRVVLNKRTSPLHVEDLRGLPEAEQEVRVEQFRQADRYAGFDISRDVLMRFAVLRTGERTFRVVWSHHHILMDGWCIGILLQEFQQTYHSLAKHRRLPDLPSKRPYSDFIEWLEGKDKEAAGAYWKQALAGYDHNAAVPVLGQNGPSHGSGKGYSLAVHEFAFAPETLAQLENVAMRYRTTISNLLQTVWSLLLAKYNHATDVVFGTVVSGRPADIAGVETMVGLFINTIPVRVQINPEDTFATLLQQVQERALSAAPYDWFPLAEMKGERKAELIQHLFVFENFPVERKASVGNGQNEDDLSLAGVELFEQTNYDFNLLVLPEDGLKVKLSYNAEVYTCDGMRYIEQHLLQLIMGILDNPEIKLDRLSILTPGEYEEQVVAFNATQVSFPKEQTLDGLFMVQAAKSPEQIALVHGTQMLSYGELAVQAESLAMALAAWGVKRGDRVSLITGRGFGAVAGMLAIMQLGAAFVPIDPDYPVERQRHLVSHAEAAVVLTDRELPFDPEGLPVVRLDMGTGAMMRSVAQTVETSYPAHVEEAAAAMAEATPLGAKLLRERKAEDLAYIIYTSGSTGQPKGVMIEHRSAVNLISWVNETYCIGAADRLLWITSMCFDLSVYDLFGLLAAGGTVVVAEKEQVQDPQELWRLLVDERITFWDSVPTTMHYFVQSLEESGFADQQQELRLAFFSGDWIPVNLKERLQAYFPQARVIGLGGATEAAVWSNYYPIERVDAGQRSIPYGTPLANSEFYILDPFGAPVPVGIAGELHIGGIGVARGYMNDPERTEAAFVANPFRSGERMYRTGDLGRLRLDGNMEFLGRKDHQVKVRGYRIELGEIEYQLLQYEGVREAVVITRPDASGAAQLCAYVVLESGREVTLTELREHVAKTLPEYMMLAHVTFLAELPLSANGKIDRKALPAPEGSREAGGRIAPATETERKLAVVWQELLGLSEEAIGTRDDFFTLGGHSLLAATMAARINAELGVELPLPLLFRYSTIEALADKLEELRLFRGEPERPVTRLNEGGENSLNVFCFPPIAGYGFEYKVLADELPHYTWYSFDFYPEASDELRIREYTQWVRELQPEGPYVLFGYSAGGNTAYEVARELEASSQTVSGLIIMDAQRKLEKIEISRQQLETETENALLQAEERYGEMLRIPSIRKEAAERMTGYRRFLNQVVNESLLQTKVHVLLAEGSEVLTSWASNASAANRPQAYQGSGPHMDMLGDGHLQRNAVLLHAILSAL